MRPRLLLPLLLCLSLPLASLAETSAPPATDAQPASSPESAEVDEFAQRLNELQTRLDDSERQRAELAARSNGAGSAEVDRLRQENQRLKSQLRDAQPQQPPRLLSDEQTWFAIGGATALLAFILGALSRGRRRQRREWIN